MTNQCLVGEYLNDTCNKTTFCKQIGSCKVVELGEIDRELVWWRTGLSILNIDAQICNHHKYKILYHYPVPKYCCDPFSSHRGKAKGALKPVTIEQAKDLATRGRSAVPGFKICLTCRKELQAPENNEEHSDSNDTHDSNDELTLTVQHEANTSSNKEILNSTLTDLDVSPLKLHGVPTHYKGKHGKRKLEQIQKAFTKKVASALNLNELELSASDKTAELEIPKEAEDLDRLVCLMKDKLNGANRREKLQILTLVPASWSIRKAASEFNVSKKTVVKARKLLATKGIIAMPNQIEGKKLSKEVEEQVKQFYCDDNYSRQMPGKKDCVSIGKKQYMSTRLLLSNLRELYISYKKRFPESKIGFSKFASLRPKWCIMVGPKGTHSVCVCTIHQNLKLMLASVSLEKSYHDLTDMIVCDRNSKVCMIHRCPSCPGTEPVKSYLEQRLQNNNEGDDENTFKEIDEEGEEEQDITFKQWTTTDRAELISQSLPLSDFIALLCAKLDTITKHSYIARSQADYLNHIKENLKTDEVVVLGDFAENYKFVIQDEIQSYHWNQQQCSLHPVVVYYKDGDDKLSVKSLVFISNDLDHDVNFVYQVTSSTNEYIKAFMQNGFKKIHYFTDGCAGQYKNCKNFLNLCFHKIDFGVDCEWNFFATSHGKSPCDGLGGTVKRLTAKASLQRPIQSQIVNAEEMFRFCTDEVKGIDFMYISTDKLTHLREELKERLSTAKTLPGTRSFHQFVPLTNNSLGAKYVSDDTQYAIEFCFSGQKLQPEKNIEVKVSQFYICNYDNFYWLGIATEVDNENQDVCVKFMHPHLPAKSFNWPTREDICWVLKSHILCAVNPPSLSSRAGRQYYLDKEDVNKVSGLM